MKIEHINLILNSVTRYYLDKQQEPPENVIMGLFRNLLRWKDTDNFLFTYYLGGSETIVSGAFKNTNLLSRKLFRNELFITINDDPISVDLDQPPPDNPEWGLYQSLSGKVVSPVPFTKTTVEKINLMVQKTMNERTTTPGTDYYKIKDTPSHPWSVNNLLFEARSFLSKKHSPEEIFDFIVREMYDEGQFKSSIEREGRKTTYELEVVTSIGDNQVPYHVIKAKFVCTQKDVDEPITSLSIQADRDNFLHAVNAIQALILVIYPY